MRRVITSPCTRRTALRPWRPPPLAWMCPWTQCSHFTCRPVTRSSCRHPSKVRCEVDLQTVAACTSTLMRITYVSAPLVMLRLHWPAASSTLALGPRYQQQRMSCRSLCAARPGPISLRRALALHADVLAPAHRETLEALAAFAVDAEEAARLRHLASPDGKAEYAAWVAAPSRSVLEVMQAFPSARPSLGAHSRAQQLPSPCRMPAFTWPVGRCSWRAASWACMHVWFVSRGSDVML